MARKNKPLRIARKCKLVRMARRSKLVRMARKCKLARIAERIDEQLSAFEHIFLRVLLSAIFVFGIVEIVRRLWGI
jgi:hypothetical protein